MPDGLHAWMRMRAHAVAADATAPDAADDEKHNQRNVEISRDVSQSVLSRWRI